MGTPYACEAGYEYIDGKCIYDGFENICRDNSDYDEDKDICIDKDNSIETNPNCEVSDLVDGLCPVYKEANPSCPGGFEPDEDGICRVIQLDPAIVDPICIEGYYLVYDVINNTYTCRDEYNRETVADTNAYCLDGYTTIESGENEGRCIVDEAYPTIGGVMLPSYGFDNDFGSGNREFEEYSCFGAYDEFGVYQRYRSADPNLISDKEWQLTLENRDQVDVYYAHNSIVNNNDNDFHRHKNYDFIIYADSTHLYEDPYDPESSMLANPNRADVDTALGTKSFDQGNNYIKSDDFDLIGYNLGNYYGEDVRDLTGMGYLGAGNRYYNSLDVASIYVQTDDTNQYVVKVNEAQKEVEDKTIDVENANEVYEEKLALQEEAQNRYNQSSTATNLVALNNAKAETAVAKTALDEKLALLEDANKKLENDITDLNETFYLNYLGLDLDNWVMNGDGIDNLPTLKAYEETVGAYENRVNEVREIQYVSTSKELLEVIAENPDASIKITNHLDFLDISANNSALIMETFTGVLDGEGHSFRNLNKTLFHQGAWLVTL